MLLVERRILVQVFHMLRYQFWLLELSDFRRRLLPRLLSSCLLLIISSSPVYTITRNRLSKLINLLAWRSSMNSIFISLFLPWWVSHDSRTPLNCVRCLSFLLAIAWVPIFSSPVLFVRLALNLRLILSDIYLWVDPICILIDFTTWSCFLLPLRSSFGVVLASIQFFDRIYAIQRMSPFVDATHSTIE